MAARAGAPVEAAAAGVTANPPADAGGYVAQHRRRQLQRAAVADDLHVARQLRIANAIILKFDLSALPAGATVDQAVVKLALVESDPDSRCDLHDDRAQAGRRQSRHRRRDRVHLRRRDAVDAERLLLQRRAAGAGRSLGALRRRCAVDKTPGFKSWTITTMVREWLASPASNFGLVLNSDPNAARDRYRSFASTKHADATLWPVTGDHLLAARRRHDAAGDLRRGIVVDYRVGGDDRLVDRRGQRLADRLRIDDRLRERHEREREPRHGPQPATERLVGRPCLPLPRPLARRRRQRGGVGRLHVHDAGQDGASGRDLGTGGRRDRRWHRHRQRDGVR